jgi:hypothetical protein
MSLSDRCCSGRRRAPRLNQGVKQRIRQRHAWSQGSAGKTKEE